MPEQFPGIRIMEKGGGVMDSSLFQSESRLEMLKKRTK